MNRRNEPRFQVYAPAKVAPLDDPESETNGQLVDVSGAGLRLVTDAEFHTDQIITVETDQHVILADVRNCLARGTKFGIGAERIHSAAKLSLPQTASKAERNRVLVEDFHRRLLEELQRSPGQVASRSSAAVERFQARQIVSGSPLPATPEPHVPSEARSQSGPILPEPLAAGAFSLNLTPVEPPGIKLDSQKPVPFVAALIMVSSNASPIQSDAEPLPLPETKAIEELPAVASVAPRLDSIREAFGQPGNHQKNAQARSRAMAILIAVLLTLAALAALLFGPFANRAPLQTTTAAKSGAAPVSTPVSTAVSTPVSKAAPPEVKTPVPAPTPSAVPPAGKSHASISASDRSWVTACADGKVVFSKLFTSGSKQDLVFSGRAVVRVGSAGPVEILLNSKPVGTLGRPGQVRVMELTPSSSRFMTPGEPGDCTQ
jgi:hypothetical protein